MQSRLTNEDQIIEDEKDLSIVEKELKALKIIKKYGHFDFYTGEYIVNVPIYKEDEFDLLKEVLL